MNPREIRRNGVQKKKYIGSANHLTKTKLHSPVGNHAGYPLRNLIPVQPAQIQYPTKISDQVNASVLVFRIITTAGPCLCKE
jgi:hypothetical protein